MDAPRESADGLEADCTLVAAARRGDKRAFGVLIGRHRSLLVALCRRVLGDAMLAEDAAQEAVLVAMLGLDRLRQDDSFGSWLVGIGLNICRARLRRRSDDWSWEAVQGGRLATEPLDDRLGPEEIAEAADLARRVRAAVDDLPRGQRTAVLLFYLAGLSQAETAALLGIEVGALKTRLHNARRTLRQRLWMLWMEETMPTETGSDWVELRVADVRRSPREGKPPQYIAQLEQVGGQRRLPIWIGRFEAESIALQLAGAQTPRPGTFAFAARVLEAAGGRLREVRITALTEHVFYAEAVVDGPAGPRPVDARPSDALNLALMAGAPIRVDPAVLDASDAAKAADDPEPWPDPYREGTAGAADLAAEIKAGGGWPGVEPPRAG